MDHNILRCKDLFRIIALQNQLNKQNGQMLKRSKECDDLAGLLQPYFSTDNNNVNLRKLLNNENISIDFIIYFTETFGMFCEIPLDIILHKADIDRKYIPDSLFLMCKFTGTYTTYYNDKNISSIEGYLDGIRHNQQIYYHKNGNISREMKMLHGYQVDYYRVYDENGNIGIDQKRPKQDDLLARYTNDHREYIKKVAAEKEKHPSRWHWSWVSFQDWLRVHYYHYEFAKR